MGCAALILAGAVLLPAPLRAGGTDADAPPAGLKREDWSQIRRELQRAGAFPHEAQLLGQADPPGLPGTGFGYSVSVEQDQVAVGAYRESAGHATVGAAYVFVRTGTTWTEQQRLLAGDGASDDRFGWAVSISGDTLVVGAPDSDVAGQSDAGSAYVFVRSGTTWTQQQKLVPSDGAGLDRFGWKVAVAGNTIAVGSPGHDALGQDDAGAAYVFVRSGTAWSEQQQIVASDASIADVFGYSVALGPDILVAGARNADTPVSSKAGAAYVFVRSGTTWTEQQKLFASDGFFGDSFGDAVSLSGDTAAVGAPFDDTPGGQAAGSAYVFVRSGTVWTEQQKLVASDGGLLDTFGWSVSVSGDTLVAGAPFDDFGSAYLFVRSGATWTEQQKVVPGAPNGIDFFGLSVSLSGDTAMVGAAAGGSDVGAAYAFVRSGGTWTEQQKILAPDEPGFDRFGHSVSASGDTVVVGAPFDNTTLGADAGSAYVFVRSGGIWTLQQKLAPPAGAGDDSFGLAVSVSGDTVAVGAPNHDSPVVNGGAVFVFVRSGTAWAPQQTLVAAAGGLAEAFGLSVAVSGDTVVVGAPFDDTPAGVNAGSASVFVRSGATWTLQQQLLASDAAAGDEFGYSVAVDGSTAVVGAPLNAVPAGPFAGAAYAFVRAGTAWSEQQRLLASDGAASDVFGAAVALSGDTAVIGAYGDDTTAVDTGSAYVMVRAGSSWSEQQKLVASDAGAGDQLGYAVAVSGDTALAGAPRHDTVGGTDAGSAYAFRRSGATWTEEAQLLAPDGAPADALGLSVSVSGTLLAAGAPLDDTATDEDAGAVHLFRNVTTADLAVTKSDGQTTVTPGQVVTYTIVVSNAGPDPAAGATVADGVPAGLQAVSWTCAASAGSTCTASGAGAINDTVHLLPGGTATYTFSGTVAPGATGLLINAVSVAPAAGGNDPAPGNNTAVDTDTIVPQADLTLAKTDAPDPVTPGGTLVYTLTAANAGPSNATGVTLVDTLPAGVTFVSSAPGPPTCAFGGSTLSCSLGALAAAGTSTVTVTTTVTAAGGMLVNTASVSAAEPDPDPGNNTAGAATAVGRRTAELTHGTDELRDLAALPGPAVHEDVFRMAQKPYASYEVVVDGTSGDIGAGNGPLLERIGADGTSVLQTALPIGAGPSRSLRWANTTASETEEETVRLRSAGCGTDCGPDDVYRIRAYETTYAAPRFNNSGTQITVLIVQNASDHAVTGRAYFVDASGMLAGIHPFSLGAQGSLVLNTSTVPGVAGVSGALTLAHDGRYGDLVGKTVALEPATGFSFDTPLEARPK